jgi:pentatricopeptide repeat domain-containing protein 1
MKQKKIKINNVTYGCMINACVKNNRLDLALVLIEKMKADKIRLNTIVYTTLIKGFSKNRRLDEALDIFATMKLARYS